ncbi:MAG: cob(I)yrinic acid a,c-diamide adenosyltransferase [Acidimicrobiales bacterium]|nr:cob(I)yrinic acid a,c-diamide adenosyltransferase [Acidimicrobiales bacterium]
MKIYTRKGDDGTTGLLYGGRVAKDSPQPVAYGDVDETQAALGLARAAAGSELAEVLLKLEGDLWLVMAELACLPEKLGNLTETGTRPTAKDVTRLEGLIDQATARFDPPTEFVVPGENEISARLDFARTVTRRAERSALAVAAKDSFVVPYLNRLSDLLWALARAEEGTSITAQSLNKEDS